MGKKENLGLEKEMGRREKKVGHIDWFPYLGCPNVEKRGYISQSIWGEISEEMKFSIIHMSNEQIGK